ncbi:MAG: divergent polysaccharide deacetylase family protein [Alphaproteobacteria bacterium]|nr:divergent polysaccharide deacetylase family protein [Alphaproteobacteria bacterium]MBU0799041.1 divergent polysaccharide deacetylase family protein [Alphaproteobacteria bacterium]MBU0886242.1 divergent polysaccharide deacetylase family protein [Alphaproteobacteria bacterium]MBU1815087.1 divergent polysaccharide deacetylase family protein [Alphaproteobacteria bacterium]
MARKPNKSGTPTRKPATKPASGRRRRSKGFLLSIGLAGAALLIGGSLGYFYGGQGTPKQAALSSGISRPAAAPVPPAALALPQQQQAPLVPPAPVTPPEQQASLPPPDQTVPGLPPTPPPVLAGDPAWRRNAQPAPIAEGKPMIAIVIDDMGIDKKRSARAMAITAPITFAFLPYASLVAKQAADAKASGHELLIHIPMEPSVASVDPGPNALMTGLTPDLLAQRLAWNLGQFDGVVGVNNHMGSKFTASATAMRPVLEELKRRGMLFLDSRTSSDTVGFRMAGELGLAALQRDVFLDNTDSHDEVAKRLAETEQVARRQGTAIAIGHPRDATLDILELWIADVQARGFVLVPLTALLKARNGQPQG